MNFYEAIKAVMDGKSMRLVYWKIGTIIKLHEGTIFLYFPNRKYCPYRITKHDIEKQCWEEYHGKNE